MTKEPGRLQSRGLQEVGPDTATRTRCAGARVGLSPRCPATPSLPSVFWARSSGGGVLLDFKYEKAKGTTQRPGTLSALLVSPAPESWRIHPTPRVLTGSFYCAGRLTVVTGTARATSLLPDTLQVCAGWGRGGHGVGSRLQAPDLLASSRSPLSLRQVFSLRKSFGLSHLPECEPVTRTAPPGLTHPRAVGEAGAAPLAGARPLSSPGGRGLLSPQLRK